jgi:hypothetical protein
MCLGYFNNIALLVSQLRRAAVVVRLVVVLPLIVEGV